MAEFIVSAAAMPYIARGLANAVDSGGGRGAVELYDQRGAGRRLVARLRFARPSAGAVEGAVLSFAVPFETEPGAPGRARPRWALATDSAGRVMFECDVGPAGSDATLRLEEDDYVREGDSVVVREFVVQFQQSGARER